MIDGAILLEQSVKEARIRVTFGPMLVLPVWIVKSFVVIAENEISRLRITFKKDFKNLELNLARDNKVYDKKY